VQRRSEWNKPLPISFSVNGVDFRQASGLSVTVVPDLVIEAVKSKGLQRNKDGHELMLLEIEVRNAHPRSGYMCDDNGTLRRAVLIQQKKQRLLCHVAMPHLVTTTKQTVTVITNSLNKKVSGVYELEEFRVVSENSNSQPTPIIIESARVNFGNLVSFNLQSEL
jgi:hypothetical protein